MAPKKKRAAGKTTARSAGTPRRPRSSTAGRSKKTKGTPTPRKPAGPTTRTRSSGRSASGPPYLHYVGARHGVKIWIVDGTYVRKNIDEEFSNFAHHFSIAEVPVDEIWLDREAHPDEQRFFIAHAVVERRAMLEGKSYDTAREMACDAEYRLREHSKDLRRVAPGRSSPEADRVHVRLRKELSDGTGVWIVNGRLVRSVFDIEFTEGGHEYVYEFVPHAQVWIDDDVTEPEIGYVILHELHERNLMAKGMTYDAAHASASKIEQRCRRQPHLLHRALAAEGWE